MRVKDSKKFRRQEEERARETEIARAEVTNLEVRIRKVSGPPVSLCTSTVPFLSFALLA